MKLEYLPDITEGGKYPHADPDRLIRLYDFYDGKEPFQLKRALTEYLVEGSGELVVSQLDFVEPLNCTLTLQVSEADMGIAFPPKVENNFVGRFTLASYINMIDIIDHFTVDDVDGFNWLYEPDATQIDLLFSPGVGSW